jgi:hypothetical protein
MEKDGMNQPEMQPNRGGANTNGAWAAKSVFHPCFIRG